MEFKKYEDQDGKPFEMVIFYYKKGKRGGDDSFGITDPDVISKIKYYLQISEATRKSLGTEKFWISIRKNRNSDKYYIHKALVNVLVLI